jgi:hypothetical protein
MIMATYVVLQQGEEWDLVYSPGKPADASQWYPEQHSIAALLTTCRRTLEDLFLNVRSLTRGLPAANATGDQFEKFLSVTNNLERGGPLLVLILPPLSEDLIPGYLAVAPWNIIIDFSDMNGRSKTDSPAWKSFSSALEGNQIKGHHIQLNERRIFGPNTEVETILNMLLAEDGRGVPWIQPYSSEEGDSFDGTGCLRDESSEDRVQAVLDQLNRLTQIITSKLDHRVLQLVIPMYGVFGMPFVKQEKWAFKNSYELASTGLDFAFPFFLRRLLNRFSNNAKRLKACVMLDNNMTNISGTACCMKCSLCYFVWKICCFKHYFTCTVLYICANF